MKANLLEIQFTPKNSDMAILTVENSALKKLYSASLEANSTQINEYQSMNDKLLLGIVIASLILVGVFAYYQLNNKMDVVDFKFIKFDSSKDCDSYLFSEIMDLLSLNSCLLMTLL